MITRLRWNPKLFWASVLAILIFSLPGGSWLLAFTMWRWKAFRECLLDGFPSLRNFFVQLLEKIKDYTNNKKL